MLFFLVDALMMALVIAGRHHDPAVGSGPHTESVDRSADTAVNRPKRQPTGAAKLPQRSTRGPVGAGEFTGGAIPGWTALDDHQLTRLLKQFSP